MLFRTRRALHRAWFNFKSRSLLKTAPLVSADASVALVSMVCHGEAMMYLLAAKSFCLHLGIAPRVVVLNDGSLTADDLALIQAHIPTVEFFTVQAISTGQCPRGSCWERLILISDLAQDAFVVQLDSDTLTSGAIPEVAACIRDNRSFTLLGDRSHPEIENMLAAHGRLKNSTSNQVQAVCERAFDQLPESRELLYLRGNAGFTGFAKGSFDRERVAWFSDLMKRVADGKWNEWGSEQITSNLLIANTPGAYPLPAPKYISYWAHPEIVYEDSHFIHFIGPFRFANGLYLKLAKRVIAALK